MMKQKEVTYEILYEETPGVVKRLLNKECPTEEWARDVAKTLHKWGHDVKFQFVRITREVIEP